MSDKKEEAKPEENKAAEGEGKEAAKGGESKAGAEMGGAKFRSVIDTTKHVEKIVLNSELEKIELEKIRRWKVQISEIYITSQEMFDCFIQFTIGGDLRINSYNIPSKNKKGKIIHGERGYNDFTEVMEILQVDKRLKFQKEFNIELRDSIISLMRQNLIIECWDYNSIKLNNLQGYSMIELMRVIRGNIYQSVIISKKEEGGNLKPICKVEFKIIFQEIWDFVLTFEDWSATNINCLFGKENSIGMYPGIEFTIGQSRTEIRNKVGQKDSANPEWGSFTGGYPIRVTLNDLDNQTLTISIIADSGSLINRDNRKIKGDLRGVAFNGLIKKNIPGEQPKGQGNLLAVDDLPEILLVGKINVNNIPKYKQIGFESVINVEEIYICINLQKLTFGQPPPYCRLPVNVFLTIEFNGKTSETVRIPIQNTEKKFNQHMYFLFGVDNRILNENKEIRLKNIIDNLKLINEVSVNLWVEDSYKCLDFIGKFNILLTDIFGKGKITEKRYKKDDNTEISYMPKVFNGEDLFESSYLKQDVRLNYEVWFYPDLYTKNIEWPKEGLKKKIKENPIIQKIDEIIIEINDEYKELKSKLINLFPDYKKRFFDYIDEERDGRVINERQIFHLKDQNGVERIANSYLSKLTIQEIKLEQVFLGFDMDLILKEKAKIDKIILPIENRKGLVHYIRCIRYIHFQFEHIVLSPDYFMQTRKGTKYEHAIFLACLMMNMYSNKYQIREDDEFMDKVEEEFAKRLQESGLANTIKEEKEKNENIKIENDEKIVSEKNKEFELIGKKKNTAKDSLNLIDNKNSNNNNNNSDLKTEISKFDKTKDMTDRSVDDLLKKEQIINKTDNFTSPKKEKIKIVLSPAELLKKKIEEELRKKPEFKKTAKEAKFDTSDLIFVCWGTLKGENIATNQNVHFWVMSFERNFKDIYFWEPMTNKKYVMKNRVQFPDILKKYFKGAYNKEEEIQIDLMKKKKKKGEAAEKKKKDKKAAKSNLMAVMLNGDDDIDTELIPQAAKDIMAEMDYMEIHLDMKKGYRYAQNQNNLNQAEEEYIRANGLQKKKVVKEENENKDTANLESQKFEWLNKFELDEDEIRNDVMPYRTIDVIFNKKNIFINKQNPNPAGVKFDLYDRDKWYSVFKIRDPGVIEDNAAKIWKQDIPAFYSFKNFLPYYTDEEIDQMKKSIISSVTNTIKVLRNQKNLNSFFKSNRDIREMLDLYLIFIEMKEIGLTNKADHKRRMEAWRQYVIDKMTNKITISIIPHYFNYSNDTLIANYIEESTSSFVQQSKKDSYFILTCKIFQYPNRVLSVRLLISFCYKVSEGDRDDSIDADLYQTEVGQEPEEEENKALLSQQNKDKEKNKGDKKK